MPDINIHPASFRDPSGFVFQSNNIYYRQVNKSYSEDYDLLMSSGLYAQLTAKRSLITHQETTDIVAESNNHYKTLLPQQIHHTTYPYEWCFDQLKDAALLTIDILKDALSHGMILKDATPYNIQFHDGAPVFIDTLSFEKYDEEKPWVAYRQFCNMFLFPLYLEHYLKTDIQKTLIVYSDGIPVDVTSKLLPLRSRTSLGVWLHVYLQNTVTRSAGGRKDDGKFNKRKLLNLIDHLEKTVSHVRSGYRTSGWSNYYSESIMGNEYLVTKAKIFKDIIADIPVGTVLDAGANDGHFSKILAEEGWKVVALDSDSQTICRLYKEGRKAATRNILPLVMDIANPSPSTGFNNRERVRFHERIKTDLVVALALVHHLVIGRNVSLDVLAQWLNDIANTLIIEFVPREDEKVKMMLASRKDVFHEYTADNFERALAPYFNIKKKEPVSGTRRMIYLMEKR